MSRHICFHCACGEAGFEGMRRFTTVVWDDSHGWLGALGVQNPYRDVPRSVDGGELLGWWEDALRRMRDGRDRLPTLYEIWEAHGAWASSAAGYFTRRGEAYMVDTDNDRLFAVRLAPGELEARRDRIPYAVPALERVAPELDAALPAGEEIALDAAAFERIFHGTPLTLEHGNLLDVLDGDLRDAVAVARHAAERGEPVELFEI